VTAPQAACKECKWLWGRLVRACPAHRKRSGTQWSEAQYAARGRGRLNLRMSAEAHDMLAEQAEEHGCSQSEYIEELIRAAAKR
jgi:predicted HicB family RNase H-like nuclease